MIYEYLDCMVQLTHTHTHTVDTRPFLPRREGPGDEAKGIWD